MAEMTSRERVLTAMRRQQPDRVPRYISFVAQKEREVMARLGLTDMLPFTRIDIWRVVVLPTREKLDYSRYYTRAGVEWDGWGRGRLWDAEGHYAEYLYPLENAETVADLDAYPWPDELAPYRFEGLEERVADAHRRGYAVVGVLGDTVYEMAWQLRGVERLFDDMINNAEMAVALLDRITEYRAAHARALARAGADIILSGDDIAMQHGLMIGRPMLNEWLFPRLKQVYDAGREENPDLLVWFHSDGKVDEVIPDLIDIGVDILNPVQPECVDHRWIKETYGDRLSFTGGIGVQSVMPHGTPAQVREHVREVIQTLGAGGGLLIAPAHVIETDTPIENVLAMVEAIDEYGGYE